MEQDVAIREELKSLREELEQERALRKKAERLLKEERHRSALAKQTLHKTQQTLQKLMTNQGDVGVIEKQQLLSARNSFLMRMSHELRTPLNAIIGYTALLLEEGDALSAEERKLDLTKIYEASYALLHMIDDVLEISRLESGRVSLQMSSFDVPHLFREAANESMPDIQRNGNEIKVRYQLCDGSFYSDPGKIRHILRRIFQEVCRWTSNRHLDLWVHCENSEDATDSILCVSLSGWTPPKEEQRDKNGDLLRMFMDTEERKNPLYLSFGLFIVQRFCRLLGGEIQHLYKEGHPVLSMRLPSLRDVPLVDMDRMGELTGI